MYTTPPAVTKVGLLLVLTLVLAKCGARTGADIFGSDGGARPGLPGGPSLSSTPSAPTSLPCTGSFPTETGDAERLRTGPCRWHDSEPADLGHPDLKFIQASDGTSIPLALVDGPGGCDAVAGQGWYLVPNVPGIIVEAPVVMTFEVCPEACSEITSNQRWLVSFNLNTCR